MAHIWIITFDVAPWEGGGGDTYCKKNIPFPGISYPQTFLQAILQIYVYESLVSSPNARNTLPWIVGKPVKLRSYFLVPMKSFPGFPSIFSTITITRAVAWPGKWGSSDITSDEDFNTTFQTFYFLGNDTLHKIFPWLLFYEGLLSHSLCWDCSRVLWILNNMRIFSLLGFQYRPIFPHPSSRLLSFLQDNK